MREKKILLILALATIIKAIIIFFFYQHVIMYAGSTPKIVKGYGWDQLVTSMHHGKYEMKMQNGLEDIFDLTSKAGRPPLYALLLFCFTCLGKFASFIAILIQAIITTLVAYLGYKIIVVSTNQKKISIICLFTLLFFPINFLKSGSIDEAPLMLVFILSSIYLFLKFIKNQNRYSNLVLSGIFLGFSTITRLTTLFMAFGLIFFIIIFSKLRNKRYFKLLLFIISYSIVLFPWILRNYIIYNKPVLSVGAARILLFTQSEEFIKLFPNRSVDDIERLYWKSQYNLPNNKLRNFDLISLDKIFIRYALSEMINSPIKYLKSIIVKFKVFFPNRYYPAQKNILKDIVFLFSYYFSLVLFLASFIKFKALKYENFVLLLAILGIVISGIIFFISSRHLYPIMILMIICSFLTVANDRENL